MNDTVETTATEESLPAQPVQAETTAEQKVDGIIEQAETPEGQAMIETAKEDLAEAEEVVLQAYYKGVAIVGEIRDWFDSHGRLYKEFDTETKETHRVIAADADQDITLKALN